MSEFDGIREPYCSGASGVHVMEPGYRSVVKTVIIHGLKRQLSVEETTERINLSPDTPKAPKGNELPEDPSNFTTRISRTVGKANPLTVAATVLVIVAFYWAQAVLIPFALAILLTFLLSPIVTRFQQGGLGRAPSVTIVTAGARPRPVCWNLVTIGLNKKVNRMAKANGISTACAQ